MRLDRSLSAVIAFGMFSIVFAQAAYAQSDGRRDYLPPWQENQNARPPAGGDAGPRPISPPQAATVTESNASGPDYGKPYTPPPPRDNHAAAPDESYHDGPREHDGPPYDDTYSSNEIIDAGHRFFGTVSKSLAKVVEHAFARQGRPNGYILGEEAGGAFVAGLRYGEGTLFTKRIGTHKVYWQGPSVGYDFGAEGSKTLILVYNISHPSEIYERFAGVDGSAYLVGGVGITFQRYNDVVLAPIRSGIGLRLGANVGYLKYTPYPTWNPF